MSCQIILMDVDGNGMFEVDEVVEVLSIDLSPGPKIVGNPKFKIIQSDMPLEEAQVLLQPEFDIFMNPIKLRDKLLYTRDLLQKELTLQRTEIVERTIVKEPETFEQTEDVVVG